MLFYQRHVCKYLLLCSNTLGWCVFLFLSLARLYSFLFIFLYVSLSFALVVCVTFRWIVESQKCVCSISEMLANSVPIFMRLYMRRTWQMLLPAKCEHEQERERGKNEERLSQNALNPTRDISFYLLSSLLLLLLLGCCALSSLCVFTLVVNSHWQL